METIQYINVMYNICKLYYPWFWPLSLFVATCPVSGNDKLFKGRSLEQDIS